MKIYTYSEARQNLATLLEEARRKGAVRVRRRDGKSFVLRPEQPARSPFDVDCADVSLRREQIVRAIRESRRNDAGSVHRCHINGRVPSPTIDHRGHTRRCRSHYWAMCCSRPREKASLIFLNLTKAVGNRRIFP